MPVATAFLIGSNGEGIYRATNITGVEQTQAIPQSFLLGQNYPNPFNPSTTIRFSLPKPAYVTLRIYNILGQEVATLLNEFAEAGFRSVRFDASGLASGVYFYRLQSGQFVHTRKLVLLR
ncbi:MAG: T9SS type A sorting domain-containing protein [Bacteroidetes bacterium]|nr:T9SS type A sorting domain-containing protein [Bacteroidota bacterium]MCW5894403.1 T9SS type A sorting domain-containing protein [Bacteroidota bacterium]